MNVYPHTHREWRPTNIPGRRHGMAWRSQNETYGAFMDARYERTYVPYLSKYGAKDEELESRRKKHKTTTENYGSFYRKQDIGLAGPRRYQIDSELLPEGATRLDDRYIPPDSSINWDGSRKSAPLPPIGRYNDVGTHQSPRRDYDRGGHQTDRAQLREVANIELSVLTKDLSSIKMLPRAEDNCMVTSYPDGMTTLYSGDIKEVNIKVRNRDGSYMSFVAVPKPNY